MTIHIGLPGFDLATIMALAVMLGAIGRGLQVRQGWVERGVGDFSYRYVSLIILSNLLLATVKATFAGTRRAALRLPCLRRPSRNCIGYNQCSVSAA